MQTKCFSNCSKKVSIDNRRVVVNSRGKKISFRKKCIIKRNSNMRKIKCATKNNIRQNRKLENTARSKLSCVYFNARSIVNKHKELEMYILEKCLIL